MSEWIAGRPPNDDGTYLVTNGKRVCPYVRGIIQNNVGSHWDWNYGDAITHWMSLPSPPDQRETVIGSAGG